jgi:hypothetical protein
MLFQLGGGQPATARIERATKPLRAEEDDVLRAAIASVHGRRIFDSRGRPTIEVEIRLAAALENCRHLTRGSPRLNRFL